MTISTMHSRAPAAGLSLRRKIIEQAAIAGVAQDDPAAARLVADAIAARKAAAEPGTPENPKPAPMPAQPPSPEADERQRLTRQRNITESVIFYMAGAAGVDRETFLNGPRKVNLTIHRHAAAWLIRETTSMSLPQIARRLGRRDHTTILAGLRRMPHLAKTVPALVAELEAAASTLPISARERAELKGRIWELTE